MPTNIYQKKNQSLQMMSHLIHSKIRGVKPEAICNNKNGSEIEFMCICMHIRTYIHTPRYIAIRIKEKEASHLRDSMGTVCGASIYQCFEEEKEWDKIMNSYFN